MSEKCRVSEFRPTGCHNFLPVDAEIVSVLVEDDVSALSFELNAAHVLGEVSAREAFVKCRLVPETIRTFG